MTQGETIIPKNEYQAQRFHELVLQNLGKDAYVRHRDYAKRSLDQNALAYVWYAQVAEQKGDETPEEVKRHCKLHYGIPIARRDYPEYRDRYDKLIKDRFSYEEKLELMHDYPVTRIFGKRQMTEYLQTMQNEYGKIGINLSGGGL